MASHHWHHLNSTDVDSASLSLWTTIISFGLVDAGQHFVLSESPSKNLTSLISNPAFDGFSHSQNVLLKSGAFHAGDSDKCYKKHSDIGVVIFKVH